jgi:hypothetical protein
MARDIRILNERRIDVYGACKLLGTSDAPVHKTTVHRAFNPGRVSPSGDRETLGCLKVGGRIMTSVEAVERFVGALNGIDPSELQSAPATETGKGRAKELADVDRRLEAAGI